MVDGARAEEVRYTATFEIRVSKAPKFRSDYLLCSAFAFLCINRSVGA